MPRPLQYLTAIAALFFIGLTAFLNSNGTVPKAELSRRILPEIQCRTPVRIGSLLDGGKWICEPWRFAKNCLVYSLGSGGNTDFEKQLSAVTKCEIFVFDPNKSYAKLYDKIPRTQFRPWTMSDTDKWSRNESSVGGAIAALNHDGREVEILKVDVEKAEYRIIPHVLKDPTVKVCQLLLEVHGQDPACWANLLQLISKHGFLLFATEPNPYCFKRSQSTQHNKTFESITNCIEYSFINQNCLARFQMSENDILQRNFETNNEVSYS